MNKIETLLLENIYNPDALFIFPTDISFSRWADHLLRLKLGGTIPMDKFIAWDKFKQNAVKSKVKNKKSIPSALRKIFTGALVAENSEAVKQQKPPVFSSLIKVEWAQNAAHFVPWLTGILPQLGVWYSKKTKLSLDNILNDTEAASDFESDDKDMHTLAFRYAQFLKKHSLFEPAWETPPFNNNGKKCFIFFPEALSDFGEYNKLLSESEHVELITLKNIENPESSASDTFYYTNSRSEITSAALYIRALHEKQHIPWDSIAVCIPESESYEPYVIREFTNRNIPFVKRTSKPLSEYPAGRFFKAIADCAALAFSFNSVVALLMNKSLPWKDQETIDQLIQFGINNNCLYSWTENEKTINIWEDAFSSPRDSTDRKLKEFFCKFKKNIFDLRSAASFTELRKFYFIFRDTYFDIDKFWNAENHFQESNLIISRCIAELTELVQLEKDFPDLRAIDPYLFFIENLNEVSYLAQPEHSGVAILPYAAAACAPFDCHVILNAGQTNLSVVYTKLGFLPRKKRENLGIFDEDASADIINLHKINSIKKSAFFCSKQTFSGFTIPHSKINAPEKPKDNYAEDFEHKEKFAADYFKQENNFFASIQTQCSAGSGLNFLHENQAQGFAEWKKRRLQALSPNNIELYECFKDHIRAKYTEKTVGDQSEGQPKTNVSASALQAYYQCSLYWLFNRVLSLGNETVEASLMEDSIAGMVYHAILNEFFNEIKNQNTPLMAPIQNNDDFSLPPYYHELLEKSTETVFNRFPSMQHNGIKPQMSSLTARLLKASQDVYQHQLENFLAHFLKFFAGCRVVESEKYYQNENDSYFLRGYIDLMLKDKDEKYIIVDFKLKKLPARGDCTAEGNILANFQLPVYITLTEENESRKVYTALFYSILLIKPEVIIGAVTDINNGKEIPAKKEEQIIKDGEKYKLLFDEYLEKAKFFANDIAAGDLRILPENDNDCLSCDYHRICRTVYVIDRENLNSLRKKQ